MFHLAVQTRLPVDSSDIDLQEPAVSHDYLAIGQQ